MKFYICEGLALVALIVKLPHKNDESMTAATSVAWKLPLPDPKARYL